MILKRIEDEVRSWDLPTFIKNTLLFLFALIISTTIHELSHVLVGLALGCKAGIQEIYWVAGASGLDCDSLPNPELAYIITAMAGPIGSFLAGLYFFFSEGKEEMERGELSSFRMFAIILFFLSGILQAFPIIPYTDFWQAINFGLNPIIAWFIFLLMAGIFANVIISES